MTVRVVGSDDELQERKFPMPLLEPVEPAAFTEQLRSLRQTRQFTDDPVPDSDVEAILEVARWSGSAKNTQPWHFIVVTDANMCRQVAEAGATSAFLADAPLVIVIALTGQSPRTEWFDEGRVSERIMLAADAHGLGAGTGWFGDGDVRVKELLGIPSEMAVRSGIGIGFPADRDQRASSVQGGRKPIDELVSRGTFGST